MIRQFESHLQSAQRLYRQRALLHDQWWVPAESLLGLESRLRVHLFVLADAGYECAEPRKAPEAFAAVAAAQLTGRPADLAPALAALGSGGDAAQGAVDALALLPPNADDPKLAETYQAQPAARAALWEVWRRAGLAAPAALLNNAIGSREAPAVTAAALRYLAAQPRAALDNFRAHYTAGADSVREAALWGGLLRGDADAPVALRRALNATSDRDARYRYLRLMALTGDHDFLPVLREAGHREPGWAAELLGLFGQAEVASDLQQSMARPECAEAAARAWRWFTGEAVPSRPRLGLVVGDETRPRPQGGNMPDVGYIRASWRQRQGDFKPLQRYVLGRPADRAGLAAAARAWAGRTGELALALLALETGGDCRPDPDGWFLHRLHALSAHARAPELPDDLHQRDPWEHGHYA